MSIICNSKSEDVKYHPNMFKIFSKAELDLLVKRAMCAVNEPNVVLTGSSCRFLAPSTIGDTLEFNATVVEQDGPKAVVEVVGHCQGRDVFSASFKTYVTAKHVLKG